MVTKMKKSEKTLYMEQVRDMLHRENSTSRFYKLFWCFFDPKIDCKMFAELLGGFYTVCDNTYEYRNEIPIAFNRAKKYKNKLMTRKAYKFYQNLPEEVTVYRGMTVKESRKRTLPFGVSWTLKKEVAEFFAYKYCRNYSTQDEPKKVLEATVRKDDIVAVFLDRNEFEVICLDVTRKNIVKSKNKIVK